MNGLDIFMYTVFTVGALYAMWLIIHLIWFGILSLYHYISDKISFYQWKKKR